MFGRKYGDVDSDLFIEGLSNKIEKAFSQACDYLMSDFTKDGIFKKQIEKINEIKNEITPKQTKSSVKGSRLDRELF